MLSVVVFSMGQGVLSIYPGILSIGTGDLIGDKGTQGTNSQVNAPQHNSCPG